MSIKTVYSSKEKTGWVFDQKKKLWRGYKLDVWVFNGIDNPLKRKRFEYPTLTAAENAALEIQIEKKNAVLGIVQAKYHQSVKLFDLFAARKLRLAGRELIRAERIFKQFIEVVGDTDVTEVRSSNFQQFVNIRRGENVKPETINRDLTVLSTAFKTASELFPVQLESYEPPLIKRPQYKKNKGKTRVITGTEKDLIISSMKQQVSKDRVSQDTRNCGAAMFEIAWLLGLRLGEVLKLESSDFNKIAKTLRVVRWKTGNVTLFEFLPARAIEILTEHATGDLIFNLGCSLHTLYDLLKKACEDNKFLYGRKFKDGITFHATRHSFTTRLIQVTDLATAQSFTGHQTAEMVGYYSHASQDSKQKAMAKMYENTESESLQSIFEKVKNNEMNFKEFTAAIKLIS